MFKENDKVKIKDICSYGKIYRLDDNNLVTLKINNKLTKTNIDNIEHYDYTENKLKTNIKLDKSYTNNYIPEIMLRHKTRDEALFELDVFIQESLINKAKEIKIIHGKNGGIIRNAVHDFLKSNKYVESYRLGGYFEGQFGVTIAKLRY